jgi:hypothetical protein
VPDTLLLAEAFWMMEGYFVRTLGMHRVYNSAFMHMLRDEDNKKYRELIIKTLEYDPQILKRYVNFMNNPDEETAISQFGSNGKYFGICVLMATLPGLPMFGHGQIEGYTEKYGMEYQRAYYNEEENLDLINRHKREIFPLLKLRYVFADVDHFYLYDVVSSSGSVIHDVFSFSNRKGSTSALVIYHNKWSEIDGRIHATTPINDTSVSILDALGLDYQNADYLLFRDHISGQEYIRSISDLLTNGLQLRMGAYHYQVFLDFRLVKSTDDTYYKLHESLQGSGINNLQEKLNEIKFEPILMSLNNLIEEVINNSNLTKENDREISLSTIDRKRSYVGSINQFIKAVGSIYSGIKKSSTEESIRYLNEKLVSFSCLSTYDFSYKIVNLACLIASICLTEFLCEISANEKEVIYDLVLKHSQFNKSLSKPSGRYPDFYLIQDLINLTSVEKFPERMIANTWFKNPIIQDYLGVNSFEGLSWFNKESFETCLELTLLAYVLNNLPMRLKNKQEIHELKKSSLMIKDSFLAKLSKSNYQVEKFLSYF